MEINSKGCYFTAIQLDKPTFYENIFHHRTIKTYAHIRGKKYQIFENSTVCHNFTPFYFNGTLYGIGGQDSWKHDPEWFIGDVKLFRRHFFERFGREYDNTDIAALKAIDKSRNERIPLRHTDGLYLFTSENGIKWDGLGRIITINHPGFNNCRAWKSADFDSGLWVQQSGEYCYLFARNNIRPGLRRIQYSRSKDLFNWDEFNLIDIKYDETINNYFIAGLYAEKHYGLIPCYDQKRRAWIDVYESNDLVKFNHVNKLFYGKASITGTKDSKNYHQPINGLINNHYFIHFNYLKISYNVPTEIKSFPFESLLQ